MNTRLSQMPSEGLCYQPQDPVYANPRSTELELNRVLDICAGCRLCFNLCPSFPALFRFVDGHDGETAALTPREKRTVVDLCYQCGLCNLKCPYTPRDKHEFQLDFPALMLRVKAMYAARHGVGLAKNLLTRPDLLAALARPSMGMANWANRFPPFRWLLQALLGVHRAKRLPSFARQPLMARLKGNTHHAPGGEPTAKAVLFATCFVNHNNPGIGLAALEVLAKNNVETEVYYQGCCGMPALEVGDLPRAKTMAESNVAGLLPWVDKGYSLLFLNPSCALMMGHKYPLLLGGDGVTRVAAAVKDLGVFLKELHGQGKLNTNFRSSPGPVAYHAPCHLRIQGVGMPFRDVLKQVKGAQVSTVAECSCHDGTWAMDKRFFHLSMTWGKKAFAGVEAAPGVAASDCPLAAVQLAQGTGRQVAHPVEVLAQAYHDKP
ncbi:MAG: heterodisulfide reductase-related iron-sulfur binding cluster [Deltaproteobacteria bacterium]|nr:heterodisulfide reductase-related iron-sulfur binding cluster [Deltaproteobacteria bacterium]